MKNSANLSGLTPAPLNVRGVLIWSGYLSPETQAEIVEAVRGVAAVAPLFHPETPSGKRMSVRMTSAGQFGWVSDRRGYRYETAHPSGVAWPEIPPEIRRVWDDLSGVARAPETCLVNYYAAEARMGLHQDRDEADFQWPVLSISLGDDALFRIGNTTRGGKTESVWLKSGDVALLRGEARLLYHGIDRVRSGSSTLLPKGGRINLTLRVVT